MLSLDIETVSTRPDAVLLTIAVVKFSTKKNVEELVVEDYTYVKMDCRYQKDRHLCPDTLLWWNKQDKGTMDEAFSGKLSLKNGMKVIHDFITKYKQEKIWCRGLNFDLTIMENAYHQLGMDVPWKYYNAQELRTLEYIASRRGVKKPKRLEDNTHHSAIGDAKEQARQIFYYHKELGL